MAKQVILDEASNGHPRKPLGRIARVVVHLVPDTVAKGRDQQE
jgi:hypothetical protein